MCLQVVFVCDFSSLFFSYTIFAPTYATRCLTGAFLTAVQPLHETPHTGTQISMSVDAQLGLHAAFEDSEERRWT